MERITPSLDKLTSLGLTEYNKMSSGLKGCKHSPSERILTKNLLEANESSKLKQALARERFTRPVKVYEALAKAAARGIVYLNIPETLLRQGEEVVSVYTDKGGVVRVRKDHKTKDFFVQSCRVLGKNAKMKNPLATNYQKYVTFSGAGVQYTLKHKRNVGKP